MVMPGVSQSRAHFDKAAALAAALSYIPGQSMQRTEQGAKFLLPRPLKNGQLYVDERGVIKRRISETEHKDILAPDHVAGLTSQAERAAGSDKKNKAQRLKLLIEMRDLVREVLDLQELVSDEDIPEGSAPPWTMAQERLKKKYDIFVGIYGPINKGKPRNTGRSDEDGEQSAWIERPNLNKFRKDPDAYRVAGLVERYDEDSGLASPGPIFSRRILAANDHDALPRMPENISGVFPPPVNPGFAREDIKAGLGMHWIPPEIIERFAQENLGFSGIKIQYFAKTHSWFVQAQDGADTKKLMVLKAALANKMPTLSGRREFDGSDKIFDDPESFQDVLDSVKSAFEEWVWSDQQRAEALIDSYNAVFNIPVPRKPHASSLKFPGSNITVEPRGLQKIGVAKGIEQGNMLSAVPVGGGKTFLSIYLAMELKRRGLAQKPCFALPLNMMGEFPRACMQLYPNASILVVNDDDFQEDGEKWTVAQKIEKLIERARDPDIDAIFMPQTILDRLKISPATHLKFAQKETEEALSLLEGIKASDDALPELIEHAQKYYEQKLNAVEEFQQQMTEVAASSYFEDTGIDCLFIDEAHAYKNQKIQTRIRGMAKDGSARAENLREILGYLREINPKHHLYSMTATPISNSFVEVLTWLQLFCPDKLREMGIENFDTWAATFGEVRESLEIAPEGQNLRTVARMAHFANLPALMRLFHGIADVIPEAALDLVKPQVSRHLEELLPSPELSAFFDSLALRAQKVRSNLIDPAQDNLLKIIMEGRKASLDPRLVGLSVSSGQPTKLEKVADNIARIYDENKEKTFEEYDGAGDDSVHGVLQAVMCDLGIPGGQTDVSIYELLRDLLKDRGIPPDRIEFVHDYESPKRRAELYRRCNSGKVSVIMGTTDKLGTGSNIQKRLLALHHMDVTWRPTDMVQRDGRIDRPGNGNAEVDIYYYLVKGSFDEFMWQTIMRKHSEFSRFMSGDVTLKDLSDDDPLAELGRRICARAIADYQDDPAAEADHPAAGF